MQLVKNCKIGAETEKIEKSTLFEGGSSHTEEDTYGSSARDRRKRVKIKKAKMTNEISLAEFRRDIKKQKEKRKKRKSVKEKVKEPWEKHSDALSKDEYEALTQHGRKRLDRPRPVWSTDTRRWTVGAPTNPLEWQILIRSEPTKKDVTRRDVESTIFKICDWFRINKFTFSECVSRLQDRQLLKYNGGLRRSKIVDRWLHPKLTGLRAGGKWHRNAIHDFVDTVNREFGCFSYPDRGFYVGAEMPDVIVVKPRLVKHTVDYHTYREPLRWNLQNPVYGEFKSAQDMREHLGRLEEQLDKYEGVPLFLEVQSRIDEARDMIEERERRDVNLIELLRKADNDMVCLEGGEYLEVEKSFEPILKKIRDAFRETYDAKARLKKTGTDRKQRECHELILYDSLGAEKNIGQVIPDFAVDVTEFAELFFDKGYLSHIVTADYIYEPSRKPTEDNKTWYWRRKKTKGAKFRSFPA